MGPDRPEMTENEGVGVAAAAGTAAAVTLPPPVLALMLAGGTMTRTRALLGAPTQVPPVSCGWVELPACMW